MIASSNDLRPRSGARFVFDREHEHPPRYRVAVWPADGEPIETTLQWDARGQPTLAPELDEGWVRAEVLKLARVLAREPKQRLTRWRGV